MIITNSISSNELGLLRTRLSGEKIVLGTGCFDLLHVGHLYFLKEARSQGDILVVAVNSDESVRAIKGSERPINNEKHRSELVGAIKYVDYVFICDDVVADECIFNLRPDVYAIGEQSVDAYPSEIDMASNIGTNIFSVKRVPSLSTTLLVTNILKHSGKE